MKENLRTGVSAVVSLAVYFVLKNMLVWNPIVAGVIAVVLYFAVYLLLKPALKIGKVNVENLKGGENMHRMMVEANEDMQAIYNCSQTLNSIEIKQKAENLHELGSRILAFLNNNPDRIPQARRFFTYYLDTGANILKKYRKIEIGSPTGEQIDRLSKETSRAMDILYEAFTKQFGRLVQNEVLDVEADIKTLEETLHLEG
ncbi:MAG: 5-bromo-4-chloroindolyl phosphate hydrolysis family protein [Eubacteriales bacterium]|nr:5-bromo-4-chloroindolyl phosphate hydrolysis family protein [Eubacteriales bacterium]